MRAYAVFAGGGAKGAALAGCLAAAQQWEFNFRGYGGTSAGSIIAVLGAVGYTGEQIGKLLIEKPFIEFLDDGGHKLDEFMANLQGIDTNGLCALFGSIPAGISLYSSVKDSLGLYSGHRLMDYLWTLVADRLGLQADARDVFTFDYLRSLGKPDLKIVASDIMRRRAVLFPRDCDNYGNSVLDAIRASAGYPFVFRPIRHGECCLVDGGIASNLPSFLFEEESTETRFPTLAFDLVQERRGSVAGFGDLIREMFLTCLEASDVLIRDVAASTYHIPIVIPPEIDTLDFRISTGDKDRLFNTAYRQTDLYLNKLPVLAQSRGATLPMQKQLMTQYGDPKLFQPILSALARDIEENSVAKEVRANIMLLTARQTRIVVYQYGMDGDSDNYLEMQEDAGCSGLAWRKRQPAIADLEEAAKNPESWGMTHELHQNVPSARKSMISVPIPGRNGKLGPEGDAGTAPVGTLSVDSITPLTDTKWRTNDAASDAINPDIGEILQSWANIVARTLT